MKRIAAPVRPRHSFMWQVLTLAAVTLASTAGCSGGLRSGESAPVVYVLRASGTVASGTATSGAARAADPAAAPVAPSLQVVRVAAGPGYASDSILLTRVDRSLDVYSRGKWAEPLPRVLNALAVDSLRAAGGWSAVHDDAAPFAADYTLRFTIRRFDADYTGGGSDTAPRIRVILDCTVARRSDRKVLGTFVAEAEQLAADNRMAAVIAAFEQAAQAAMTTVAAQARAAVARALG